MYNNILRNTKHNYLTSLSILDLQYHNLARPWLIFSDLNPFELTRLKFAISIIPLMFSFFSILGQLFSEISSLQNSHSFVFYIFKDSSISFQRCSPKQNWDFICWHQDNFLLKINSFKCRFFWTFCKRKEIENQRAS